MLSYVTDSLHIRVSCTAVTVLKTAGWPRAQTTLMADARLPQDPRSEPERFSEALTAILAQSKCSGMATYIMLADDLVRLFMVTPPQNIERFADCQAAAAMRFHALYDESLSAWKIDADWHTQHPFLACAMPQALWNALQHACSKHRLKLIQIQPQFVIAYNRCYKSAGVATWLASVQGTTITLGAFDLHRLYAVRQIALPDHAWQDESCLPHHLAREALRFGLSVPKQLSVCGDIPGSWTTCQVGSLTCSRIAHPFFGPSLAAAISAAEDANVEDLS